MWRESQTGPDWVDVMESLVSIGQFHNANISITLRPDTRGHKTTIQTTLRATEAKEAGLAGLAFVQTESEWPNPDHKTLTGHLLNQLMQLDSECATEMWAQTEFKPE